MSPPDLPCPLVLLSDRRGEEANIKTLMLRNGDLVIGSTGHATVTGAAMVAQDLRCALGEPLGNDRFHPGYGSVLGSFVGAILDDGTAFLVEQEVNRVVSNYAAIQNDRIQRDALTASRSRFSTADVVANASGVSVHFDRDVVQVSIDITTMSGDSVTVTAQSGG